MRTFLPNTLRNTTNILSFLRISLLFAVSFLFSVQITWAVDASYYSSLNGKKDSELRSALTQLLYNNHTLFSKYDWDFPMDISNGLLLDIYTTDCSFPSFSNSNAPSTTNTCCCDGVNREHVLCQSTFGQTSSKDKIPQYSDRHHLYPTDAHTNSFRNNFAYGECRTSSNASHGTCSNSSVRKPSEGTSSCANHALGWLGTVTTYSNLYTSDQKVYEVADEYKGDIARAILYMVVRYAEKTYCRLPDGAQYCTASGGGSVDASLTTENNYPVTAWINSSTSDKVGQLFSTSLSTNYGLSAYGKAILLKWHRQDPVSQKEIDRNAGVEAVQGNRNPFVDYPCLVEYLWGNKTGTNFNTSNVSGSFQSAYFVVGASDGCTCTNDPVISQPSGTIDVGVTNTVLPISQTVVVRGVNLASGSLSLGVSGGNAAFFSVSPSPISKTDAENGTEITITYSPNAVGNHSTTLTISGCGVSSHTVTLTGTCEARPTVTWVTDGTNYYIPIVSPSFSGGDLS